MPRPILVVAPPQVSPPSPFARLRVAVWRLLAAAGRRILPSWVREPIQRRLGKRADRRRVIDLSHARVLRQAPIEELTDPGRLEELLIRGGLNDELLEQFPARLHPFTGYGLRLWQHPNQFSRYLLELSHHGVERYLEIGIRHGGSFVATVEYLNRFTPLREAVAVDIDPVPSLLPYPLAQPSVRLMQADTQSEEFAAWVRRHEPFDLAFVDGLHTYDASRRDFETVREHARLIALHDIVSPLVPDVGRVWADVRRDHAGEFEFLEFVDQYPELARGEEPQNMGIGLAVRRTE
jgi:Methyltransferase domain